MSSPSTFSLFPFTLLSVIPSTLPSFTLSSTCLRTQNHSTLKTIDFPLWLANYCFFFSILLLSSSILHFPFSSIIPSTSPLFIPLVLFPFFIKSSIFQTIDVLFSNHRLPINFFTSSEYLISFSVLPFLRRLRHDQSCGFQEVFLARQTVQGSSEAGEGRLVLKLL